MLSDLVKREIPVYLFTGFLDSGKTKFIQETLEDSRFNTGERTLLLMCEDGEEEYDPSRFSGNRVYIRKVENESDLTTVTLRAWQRETRAERVLVEYNGMWMLNTLYNNMPETWTVYQEFMFAEYSTFQSYNANMRQLVFDKLSSCEMVVFNRADKGADMMPLHQIVRAVNRRCDIAYEDCDGNVSYDDIEDPLPFDLEAPVVEIDDKDYAIWYRDLGEEMEKYECKTVEFRGQVSVSDELPDDCFIIGRQMMNCCAADISFAGLAVEGAVRTDWETRDWVHLKAKIHIKAHPAYDRPGPVLQCLEVTSALPAEEEVATFY